jgi:hypothetical protein
MTPLPPNESQLTRQQRIALKRIGQLLLDHFHRGLVTVVFKGEDQKLHVQVISNCNTEQEQIDLARRTLQQVEKSTTGLITTLSPEEKRLIT